MRETQDELTRLEVDVLIVTFEAGAMARAYIEQTGFEWPILVDRDRRLYEGYDMLRASFWDLWGPSTWFAYARALLAGHRLQTAGEDVDQRGGDVLVDPGGLVRIHHVGQGPADRPAVGDLLDRVRSGA